MSKFEVKEPSSESLLNVGVVMQMTGNDRIFARNLSDIDRMKEFTGNDEMVSRNIISEVKNLYDKNPANTFEEIKTEEQAYILGTVLGTDFDTVSFPKLADSLNRAFVRGWFDVRGIIHPSRHSCAFQSIYPEMLDAVQEKMGVKGRIIKSQMTVVFSGVNCLDFLSRLYEGSSPELRVSGNYEKFVQLLTFYNTDADRNWNNGSFKCLWKRNDKNALSLRKNRCSDSGYDLALIRKEKQLNQSTALYDTGISVSPPAGYYFDVVPRSSISKTGYMLANSTGIIDASYSGSIKVALIKADDSVPELELPNYMVQLIPRKYIHFDFQEVEELEQTERADKGFGSTENQVLHK